MVVFCYHGMAEQNMVRHVPGIIRELHEHDKLKSQRIDKNSIIVRMWLQAYYMYEVVHDVKL